MDKRTCSDTKGLGANPAVWESIIPYWSMENGELKELLLYPIEIGYGLPRYRRGWPEFSQNSKIIEKLADLSKPFSTDIRVDNGVGRICLQR
ncbi:MAG: hypothetical protein VB122_01375 [Erysipelotrichales bacterium]|nr:hypothetical protein [Erysipelotrichales bacterium]